MGGGTLAPNSVDCLPVFYFPFLQQRDNLLQMTPYC